ncbi:uncharacterized protein C18orf19 homolog A, partial [Centroberyx gerrardi]|uniref:uncharacterized protein C18orf19 homolog A-like n=1 Tax=Centroberyx gerrardi TaxID=166262 RepID=UPI003AAFA3AB
FSSSSFPTSTSSSSSSSTFSSSSSTFPTSSSPPSSPWSTSKITTRRGFVTSASFWTTGRPPPTGVSQSDGAARSGPSEPGLGPDADPLQDGSVGLVSRFKRTLRQYGKVLVPVHLLTSAAWFTSFYYAAMNGVNVVPVLEFIPGFPERIINLLQNSQSGHALTAYALYKIATPARYTVSLGGTSLSVKYLRRHGYMSTPPPVKEYLQDKMEETKERLSGRLQETKDKVSFRRKKD